jgi:hypothetical protein
MHLREKLAEADHFFTKTENLGDSFDNIPQTQLQKEQSRTSMQIAFDLFDIIVDTNKRYKTVMDRIYFILKSKIFFNYQGIGHYSEIMECITDKNLGKTNFRFS